MGRVAFLINAKRLNPEEQLLDRVKIAHALLYLSRGIPVVYYGDEVGMTGSGNGNDQRARQNMFPTQVEMWKSEKRVGSNPVGDGDSFSKKDHPISEFLRNLAELRNEHPALANGVMQIRYAKGSVFAFSKRAIGGQEEYLVVLNNSAKKQKVAVQTASSSSWKKIFGDSKAISKGSRVAVEIEGLGIAVFKAKQAIKSTRVEIVEISNKADFLSGLHKLSANINSRDIASAEFFISKKGAKQWKSVGVDLNQPFAVYLNPTEHSGSFKYKVVVTDSKGERYESKQQAFAIAAP
jgi:hypothetical protein